MNPTEVAKRYLSSGEVMQLGTLHGNYPRVVSVYYVATEYMNAAVIYWMSEPDKRHSIDLQNSKRIGGAIVGKVDWPVAGLQFVGMGDLVEEKEELQRVIDMYNAKYHDVAKGLFERIRNNTSKHRVYKLSIESLELFDEEHFPNDGIIDIPLG